MNDTFTSPSATKKTAAPGSVLPLKSIATAPWMKSKKTSEGSSKSADLKREAVSATQASKHSVREFKAAGFSAMTLHFEDERGHADEIEVIYTFHVGEDEHGHTVLPYVELREIFVGKNFPCGILDAVAALGLDCGPIEQRIINHHTQQCHTH